MLDNVSNLVVGLDGEGGAGVFADYSQWEEAQAAARKPVRSEKAPDRQKADSGKKRLSYLEAREWGTIEKRIEDAEAAVNEKHIALDNPAVNTNPSLLQKTVEELGVAQEAVDELYARWGELGAKVS